MSAGARDDKPTEEEIGFARECVDALIGDLDHWLSLAGVTELVRNDYLVDDAKALLRTARTFKASKL